MLPWAGLGDLSARRTLPTSIEHTAAGGVMKVQASVRRMCAQCQIIRRKGKVRVICKADPKHKQVQG